MGEEKKMTNAILVKDDSIKDIRESKILNFLNEQSFRLWRLKDYPACNWIYISLNDKTFMPGIPGVAITAELGNHAITVEEFFELYKMFEKYDGLEPLCMTKEDSVIKKMRGEVSRGKRDAYFDNLSYEEYLLRCKNFVVDMIREKEPEKYIDAFMKKEEKMFKSDYDNHRYPNARGYEISLMYDRYEVEDKDTESEKSFSLGVLESVDLTTQAMVVSIQVFEDTVLEEDKVFYNYRVVAEDETTTQVIDIDLEDTVSSMGIAELYLALDHDSYEKEQLEAFSWGCIEFMPWGHNGTNYLTMNVYPDNIPEEGSYLNGCNYFNLEFKEAEIIKLKQFLFNLYQKINELNEE